MTTTTVEDYVREMMQVGGLTDDEAYNELIRTRVKLTALRAAIGRAADRIERWCENRNGCIEDAAAELRAALKGDESEVGE